MKEPKIIGIPLMSLKMKPIDCPVLIKNFRYLLTLVYIEIVVGKGDMDQLIFFLYEIAD